MSKKFCLILPSLKVGGMERVMTELAEYFSVHKGVETHLIVMTKSEHFYSANNNVILHQPDFVFNTSFRMFYNLKTILFLRRTVKLLQPSSVLSFGETYNAFVLLATLKLNTKVFVSDRSKPDKRWGKFQEWLRKFLYPHSYGIVSQTQFSKNYLHSLTSHQNIRVIPNPVRSFNISGINREKIILSVGRLIASKKTDILLEIFSKLNCPDWQLWIVGDGPQRNMLEEISRQLKITDRVTFWGSQKDLGKFYSKASIFAFTSVSEGFPNVLLEAMSAGLGCISFNCVAGPSDIIEDGVNGFLIPELDTDKYQLKLQQMMQDTQLLQQVSAAAINRTGLFHIDNIGEQYFKFLVS
jgi:glycosyltransferase involved in cell wall biosynthesis